MIQRNCFAEILKAQGEYVINVDGTDWYGYQGFMMPAYLPHCTPIIAQDTAKAILRISGRPFIRWNVGLGINKATPWWYILKRGTWDIDQVSNKKKRWMIRQGRKNFQVRPLTLDEVLKKCPDVAQSAAQRYQGPSNVENAEVFLTRVRAAEKIEGAMEYIGCFCEELLVSYSENYIQDNAVWLATIRHNPDFLQRYSSYALVDGILEYYLNNRKMDYVLDGSRSIHHRTGFQDHLESVFCFTREYSLLNVVYSKKFGGLLSVAYPFHKLFMTIHRKWVNSFFDNICAVLRQESIRRLCESTDLYD